MQALNQGVCRGGGQEGSRGVVAHHPKKPTWKILRKELKKIKIQEINQIDHNAVYKWVKLMRFREGIPP